MTIFRGERLRVKRNNLLMLALMAAGTATVVFAAVKWWQTMKVTPYSRPKGGERVGDFEAFIGS